MTVRDLSPWGRNSSQTPSKEGRPSPFLSLHREVNRLFDEVFRGFEAGSPTLAALPTFGAGVPCVEVTENDADVRVTAELPGLEKKDVEVVVDQGILTLRGQKESVNEDKRKRFSERFYGHFERKISLGRGVDEDRAEASFKNGVLTVVLPKVTDVQPSARRIAISS